MTTDHILNAENVPRRLAPVEHITGRTPKQKQKKQYFYLATYNVRTLKSENKMMELKCALGKIHWDVVGLSETRILGEAITEQSDGDLFSYIGTTKGLYGVGFLIKNEWKNSIIEIKSFSERITMLRMKMVSSVISILQIYSPTSKANIHEIEIFYSKLDDAMNYCKGDIKVVMGDFNARVGQRCSGEEMIMGPFCYGQRNERGDRLIQWIWQRRLSVCNTLFKKKESRKWTWRSPQNEFFEIDYILINKKDTVMDLEILNKFDFDSDHRIVRVKLLINHKTLRKHKSSIKDFKNVTQDQKSTFKDNILQRKNVLGSFVDVPLQKQYDRFENSIKKSSVDLPNSKTKHTVKTVHDHKSTY